MKPFLLLLILSAYSISTSAQNSKNLLIQQIELKDSIIIREITKLIKEESNNIDLIRNTFGYVSLGIQEYNEQNSIQKKYIFYISFTPIDNKNI